MSKEIQPFAARVWLKAAAEYFESRPANGEDQEHWASVYNAGNARAIADLIERQSKIIDEMRGALEPFAGAIVCVDRETFIDVHRPTNDDYFRARSLSTRMNEGEG